MWTADYIKLFSAINDYFGNLPIESITTNIFGQPIVIDSAGNKYGYQDDILIHLSPDGVKTLIPFTTEINASVADLISE